MYAQEEIKPYGGAEPKEREVERMFDSIAHSYDRLNHLLSLGIDRSWRRKAIAAIGHGRHDRILDVATGTGDFAFLVCDRLHPRQLVACDLSECMMDIGRRKAHESSRTGIVFQREDCLDLSFDDESFDVVTVAYGVRNFSSLERGLGEMRRVLEPGGRLVILELSVPRRFPMKQLFWLYSHVWMPLVGKLLSGDHSAYRYLPATMEAFPQAEAVRDILLRVGFSEVAFKRYTFGLSTMFVATR